MPILSTGHLANSFKTQPIEVLMTAFIIVLVLIVGKRVLESYLPKRTKHLQDKRFWLWYTKNTLAPLSVIYGPFFLAVTLVFKNWPLLLSDYLLLWIVSPGILIMFISVYLVKRYALNYSYVISEGAIRITKGLLFKHTKNIPLDTIDDVLVSDDFFHKIFNLKTIDIVIKKKSFWKIINYFVDTYIYVGASNPEHTYKYGKKVFYSVYCLTLAEAERLKNELLDQD